MVPPFNISEEIIHQLIGRGELIVRFLISEVPVVTLGSFIIIAQHTVTADNIGQPVLEPMRRRRHWLRNTPYRHLYKCIRRDYYAPLNQWDGPHEADSGS